jgi:hypothetical protein
MVATPTEEQLVEYYNRCNPDESLGPDDPRNVDLDDLPGAVDAVRGRNWAKRMALDFSRSSTPVCKFFSGLRGSGKSTELKRLARKLRDEGLLPLIVNMDGLIDLSSPIDVPDLLSIFLHYGEVELLKEEKRPPEEAMTRGAFQRFWDYVSQTDLEWSKAEFGLQQPWVSGKITVDMRTNPVLRERVRKMVTAHLSRFIEEARQEFSAMNERARLLGFKKGLVLIVDSLERLQGTSTNWVEVLASAERIFANGAPYLQLPVHALYTFPPALTRRLSADVYYLPMIKLRTRDGKDSAAGFEAIRTMLLRRVPEEILRGVFGDTLFETRLRELILWSGGYPRDLIRLLQLVLSEDTYPLSESLFRGILQGAGDVYARLLSTDSAVALIARVARTHSLQIGSDEQQAELDRLLSNNMILRYMNRVEWVDVHPAIRKLPQVEEAIKRQEEQAQSGSPPAPLPLARRRAPRASAAPAPGPHPLAAFSFLPPPQPISPRGRRGPRHPGGPPPHPPRRPGHLGAHRSLSTGG